MDMRGCAATPRRPSGHRQKQNGYRASQRRREMATKPSPSWPPFPIPNFGLIVKLRGNRSFLSSKTFNDRLFPPPRVPPLSSPHPSSLEIEPNFRIVASAPYISPSPEKIFSKRNYALLRCYRDGVFFLFPSFSFRPSYKSRRRERIRFSNRAGSYRSSPLLSPFNYAFDALEDEDG